MCEFESMGRSEAARTYLVWLSLIYALHISPFYYSVFNKHLSEGTATGSSFPFTYHSPIIRPKKINKKNTLSATTVALRIYHPLIQSKSLSAVNSSSFLWSDVTAWCYSLLYNSYLSFYFFPTSCFELCLSAFPFLLQTKRVPCRLRALDVETQKRKKNLNASSLRTGSSLNTYLSEKRVDDTHLSCRT